MIVGKPDDAGQPEPLQYTQPFPAAPDDHAAVVAERGSRYGRPEDNHQCSTDFWRVWAARRYGDSTHGPMDALDWIVAQLCQKLSRAAFNWHTDNWIDLKGYAENALMLPDECRNTAPGNNSYTSPLQSGGAIMQLLEQRQRIDELEKDNEVLRTQLYGPVPTPLSNLAPDQGAAIPVPDLADRAKKDRRQGIGSRRTVPPGTGERRQDRHSGKSRRWSSPDSTGTP